MIKNASKLLYAIAGLSVLAAILVAGFTGNHKIGMDTLVGPLSLGWKGYVGNHVAYVILISAAVTALALGILVSGLKDGDPQTIADAAGQAVVAPAQVAASTNYWPIIGAFSFALLAVGLAVGPVVFVMGIVGVSITLIEWTVRTWSDRATGDHELNAHLRNALMFPFEFPAAGVLVLGGTALAMWKIMMALPSVGSIVVFSAVPAIILALGAALVLKPKISQNVIAVVVVVGAIALITGGIVAAIVGERDHHGEGHEGGSAPVATVVVNSVGN